MNLRPWLSQNTIDANAEQLGAFAVYLWQFGMNNKLQGNTYSTICGKLCAIRWFHKNSVGYDPGVNASHAILLRGIRRFTNPVVKQQPLTPRLLRLAFSLLDLTKARHQLLWGGLLLGYFFLFRRSEYLFIGRRYHIYILRLSDIKFFDEKEQTTTPKKGVMVGITLRGAKNNQFGREEVRYHSKSGDALICPVRAARLIHKAARALRTRPDQPALATPAGGITSRELATLIKAAAENGGLDSSRFSTHSVRIGGATALLNAGADRLAIKTLGRWLSNAFESYPVLTSKGSAKLSRLMC